MTFQGVGPVRGVAAGALGDPPAPVLFPAPHFPVDAILQVGLIAVRVFMLVKVSQNQVYSPPIPAAGGEIGSES
jgi:hypothetical protein